MLLQHACVRLCVRRAVHKIKAEGKEEEEEEKKTLKNKNAAAFIFCSLNIDVIPKRQIIYCLAKYLIS